MNIVIIVIFLWPKTPYKLGICIQFHIFISFDDVNTTLIETNNFPSS